jgi:phospholipid/cholesterol/gamma-HCH transport system substrate-binding protein
MGAMAAQGENRNILIGGAVLLALIAGLVAIHINSAREKTRGYPLLARFDKAEGVRVGTEVRLSGVTVGKVTRQALDDNFRAVLTLQLDESVKLPDDSNAAIQTDGLLRDKFIALQPGGDEKILKAGQEIAYTQSSLSLQDLLDMIISQAESAHGSKAEGGTVN